MGLPNSYHIAVELAAKGMTGKINPDIRSNPFTNKQRGKKIFYRNHKHAERVLRQEEHPEAVLCKAG